MRQHITNNSSQLSVARHINQHLHQQTTQTTILPLIGDHQRKLTADYIRITHELRRIARDYGESRVMSYLEGGYDLPSLGRSATAYIKELAEFH